MMTSIRLLPLQGAIYSVIYPGRCPGLVSRWPFYKSLLLGILKTSFRLLSLIRDFQAVFAQNPTGQHEFFQEKKAKCFFICKKSYNFAAESIKE